ncbi:MAG: SGNH/GDSL hydrolase family protein [Bacteroidota bacterium]
MAKKTLIFGIYYLIFLPLLLGFYFHKSAEPQILIYNYPYFFVLLFLSILLLGLIPYLVHRFIKRLGFRKFLFALSPTVLVLLLLYLFCHYRYYAVKQHPFDPFLQAPHTQLDLTDFAEDEVVILALGGSTTRNIKLAEEDRYPYLLEQQLTSRYPQLRIRVVNAGMPWYTSKHSLITYETYFHKLQPDMVIIMHAINDISRSFSPPEFAMGPYQADYSHYYGPSIRGAQAKSFERAVVDVGLQYWFSSVRKHAVDFPITTYRSLDSYTDYLSRLIQNIQKDGANVLILEQRSLYKASLSPAEQQVLTFGKLYCNNGHRYASPASLLAAMNLFNNQARKIARQEGARFVELKASLPSELTYFRDDVHYTPLGTARIAKEVAAYIQDQQLITAEASP